VIRDKRPPKEWPTQGNIKFKNYSVKYRDELDHVLKSVNTDIRPGEKVVLFDLQFT
jgi:ABC-type multidrug transport system fused ATPase/permease subunit